MRSKRKGIFARSVFYYSNLIPKYLVNGGYGGKKNYKAPIWKEFSEGICWLNITLGGNMRVWKFTGVLHPISELTTE